MGHCEEQHPFEPQYFGLIVLKLEFESLFSGNRIPENNKIEEKPEVKLIHYNLGSPSISLLSIFLSLSLYIIDIKAISFSTIHLDILV